MPQIDKTHVPQLDAFIRAEITLIGGEEDEEIRLQLWRILYNGIRAILTAQLRLPVQDEEWSDESVKRRLNIIKEYLENSHGESTGQGSGQ